MLEVMTGRATSSRWPDNSAKDCGTQQKPARCLHGEGPSIALHFETS
jgi:hypothetical protein